MRQITLQIPDQLDLNDYEIRMAVAVKLYETGKASIGQAADIAGTSKQTLIENMGMLGTSIFVNYTVADLAHDIEHA